MSIKTEDSLNCPCNGIYKCGLHSPLTEKLVGHPSFERFMEICAEFGDWPLVPEWDVLQAAEKYLKRNDHKIFLTSTPHGDKGFFYEYMKKA